MFPKHLVHNWIAERRMWVQIPLLPPNNKNWMVNPIGLGTASKTDCRLKTRWASTALPSAMDTFNFTAKVIDDVNKPSTNIIDLLIISNLVKSKREARDLIVSGGIYLNGARIKENRDISTDDLVDDRIILRRGKKSHSIFRFLNIRGT